MINFQAFNGAVKVSLDPQSKNITASFHDGGSRIQAVCAGDFKQVDEHTEGYLRELDGQLAAGVPLDPARLASRHLQLMPQRLALAMSYLTPRLRQVAEWLVASRETTNFTYGLTERSLTYLSHTVALVAGIDQPTALAYIREPEGDADLNGYVTDMTVRHGLRFIADDHPNFGRRLGWYAMVRARKPAVVIETGVDKGMGSVLLCAALRRNAAEGRPGTYYGTDINPQAGYLLGGPYAEVGRILYGDSVETLKTFDRPIDLFVNDSDHSVEYERVEYATIRSKLAPGAVVLGDNSHNSTALVDFAEATGRRFLFFREEPRDHWYPGAGIGMAF